MFVRWVKTFKTFRGAEDGDRWGNYAVTVKQRRSE